MKRTWKKNRYMYNWITLLCSIWSISQGYFEGQMIECVGRCRVFYEGTSPCSCCHGSKIPVILPTPAWHPCILSRCILFRHWFSFILEASRIYWTVSNVILAYHHACFPFMACSTGSAINRDAVIPRLSFKKQLLKWRYGLRYTRLALQAAD